MKKLFIEVGKMNDPYYIKYYIWRFLGALANVEEQHFKDKSISLQGMSLVMADWHIKQVIQEHSLEKRVSKKFKRFDNMFTPSLCKHVGDMPKRAYDTKYYIPMTF